MVYIVEVSMCGLCIVLYVEDFIVGGVTIFVVVKSVVLGSHESSKLGYPCQW